MEVAGVVVVALLALVALVVVLLACRKGWRPSLNPVVAWNPHAAIQATQAQPVTGQPVQALPAPQLHIHFHDTSPADVAELIHRIDGRTS